MAVKEKTKIIESENPVQQDTDTKLTEKSKRKLSKYWIFIIIYTCTAVGLNLLSFSKSFSDFYTDNIFWLWGETYGRFSGMFPFSLGEVLIPTAMLIVLVALVLSILLIFLRKRKGFVKFTQKYLKCVLTLLLTILMVMTLNCNILYRSSNLEINGNGNKKYSTEQIQTLRNYVVEKCNELAPQVQRDENGFMVLDENVIPDIKTALRSMSDEFPRMSGYYPNPKPVMGSYFMYQAGILGVYFPFTMEANYNTYTSASYTPSVIAHELSHLKGYIYEDEANFLAYLACINSDNVTVQYSGYLSVLYYADSDYHDCVSKEVYSEQVRISDLVLFDNYCYDDATLKTLAEEESVFSDELMESVNETITDTYLDYYEAEANYDEVTLLMLQYYDGNLY